MKKSRFSTEQIVGISGGSAYEVDHPEVRHIGPDVLPLEGEVRRDGGRRSEAAEGAATSVKVVYEGFRIV